MKIRAKANKVRLRLAMKPFRLVAHVYPRAIDWRFQAILEAGRWSHPNKVHFESDSIPHYVATQFFVRHKWKIHD